MCFFKIFLFAAIAASGLLCCPATSTSESLETWSNLGLYGGQIYAIAIDPSTPDKMFAGSYMGDGFFVSGDKGLHWQAVESGNNPLEGGTFKNQSNRAIVIAPSDPKTIWVAHDYWVEKSIDGGNTWTHISHEDMQVNCTGCIENDYNRFCQAVAIHPTNPDIVYVGTGGPFASSTNGAIYKTEDGGATWMKMITIFDWTWNPIPDFNAPVIRIEIDGDSNNIWVATGGPDRLGGSLYFSNDQGGSWWEYANLPDTFWLDMTLQPHAAGQPSQVFIATEIGLLRITFAADEWATWLDHAWILGGALGTENGVRSVVCAPSNPNTVYAAWYTHIAYGGDGIGKIGRSTDGGKTWSTYVPDLYFLTLSVHPSDPDVIYGGHYNLGMFKSQDHGQTWKPINQGLNAVIVKDVAVDPHNPSHILLSTVSGVYQKKDSDPFSRIFEDESDSVLFHPNDNLTFFAGTEGHVNKTLDGGLHWTSANIPDHGSISRIADMDIVASDPEIMYVAVDYRNNKGGAIYKSENGGKSFTKALEGVNKSNTPIAMYAVAIDPANPRHVFAGGGFFYAPGDVGDLWESTDGGNNWKRTTLQDVIVNALLIDPLDSNIIYAGCGNSGGTWTPIWRSTDGGVTWLPSFSGIPILPEPFYNPVTDLQFHRQHSRVVYASTLLQGIFISPNQGGNWLNLGTPAYATYAISISSLYAGTQGGLLQCTGTGLIAGSITDSQQGGTIDQASVYTDFGVYSQSIAGEYMMIVPAGLFDVTVVADDHANQTVEDVSVLGGDISWLDVYLESGYPEPYLPAGMSDTASSGKYCFIGTASSELFPELIVWIHWRLWIYGFILIGILISRLTIISVRKHKRDYVKLRSNTSYILLIVFTAIAVLWGTNGHLQAATIFQNIGVASSPNPVGSGARAIGMGGAFIGIADDATAASWNPAGLIQLETPELSLVGDYNVRQQEFSADSNLEIDNSDNRYAGLNYLSVAYPFHFHRNMVVSINYQRLYDFKQSFGYQRDYTSVGLDAYQSVDFDQDGSLSALGFAAAIQATPHMSLGLTLNVWTDELLWDNGWRETYNEHATGSQGGIPTTINTRMEDQYNEFRGINVNIGLLWSANSHLTVGAVAKTPFTASLLHESSFQQVQTFGEPLNSSTNIEQQLKEDVDLTMPMSLGLGFAWRFSDAFSMDVDGYWTDWSEYILEDDSGNQFSPIDGRPADESNVEDTIQVRLGGEYLFILEDKNMAVPLRAGLFYDPEPSEGSPKDFFGFSIGSGISYRRFVFDVAYQLRYGNNMDAGNLILSSTADIIQHTVLASLILHF